MRGRVLLLLLVLGFCGRGWCQTAACRRGVIEGEVKAGEGFSKKIGNGLAIGLEPLASGWILRVVPASGPRGDHDYAELATPPYESVNPLLVSTDFSFRAQDAVGWNPRRFRFATDAASFAGLREAYLRLRGSGPHVFGQPFAGGVDAAKDLEKQISLTAEGTLQIVDARLVAGTADQWVGAASVASHFDSTAHTVQQAERGKESPLGRLVWLRFRMTLDLPPGFRVDSALKTQICR